MQPQPKISKNSIHVLPHLLKRIQKESVKKLLLEREALGLKKYGVALHSKNGRDFKRDCIEELADCMMYLEGIILEGNDKKIFVNTIPLLEIIVDNILNTK